MNQKPLSRVQHDAIYSTIQKKAHTRNTFDEYEYKDDSVQGPTLPTRESYEMRSIKPQDTSNLVTPQFGEINEITTRQESVEHENAKVEKKGQRKFCVIDFNIICLICLFVVAGGIICKIIKN